MTTPAQLALTVVEAVRRAVRAGELDAPVPKTDAVRAQRPRVPGRGDYATGIALRLARRNGLAPLDVAGVIARRLSAAPGIARVEIAEPGFLNITLDSGAHAGLVRTVRAQGIRYGHGDALAGAPAYPEAARGPRAAATGRLLAACGATVGPAPADGPGPAPDPERAVLGADATAWAHVRPPAGDPPDLRPASHLPQVVSNPLFRIRYAHARSRALLRNAGDLGFGPAEGTYEDPAETALLGVIGDYPRVVEAAARAKAPDRVARALEGVADAYLDFQDTCPVLPMGDEKPSAAHRARLALADAAGTVLAGGLTLLGISAPEHL